MPHLQGKQIPMFIAGDEEHARSKVGTALVVHHDPSAVEFYVRLEDPKFVEMLRRAPVQGLFFEISKPTPVGDISTPPLEYPIQIVDQP